MKRINCAVLTCILFLGMGCTNFFGSATPSDVEWPWEHAALSGEDVKEMAEQVDSPVPLTRRQWCLLTHADASLCPDGE